MNKLQLIIKSLLAVFFMLMSFTSIANAETTMSEEGQYIFNTLGFYLGGVLVAFMAAGFCMLESGLVTTKSFDNSSKKHRKICNMLISFFSSWL